VATSNFPEMPDTFQIENLRGPCLENGSKPEFDRKGVERIDYLPMNYLGDDGQLKKEAQEFDSSVSDSSVSSVSESDSDDVIEPNDVVEVLKKVAAASQLDSAKHITAPVISSVSSVNESSDSDNSLNNVVSDGDF
jgi:hypothetical protein